MFFENFNFKVLLVNFCLDIIILLVYLNIIWFLYMLVVYVISVVFYFVVFMSLFELSFVYDVNGLVDYNGVMLIRF